MLKEVTLKQLKSKRFHKKDELQFVMFYGSSCGPCKATMPNYEQAANFFTEKGAKITFYKFNAWEPNEHREHGAAMEINGVPTFLGFYNGDEVFRESGGGNYEKMHGKINGLVDKLFRERNIKI